MKVIFVCLANKIYGIFAATPGKEGRYISDPWIIHRFQETYDQLSEAPLVDKV